MCRAEGRIALVVLLIVSIPAVPLGQQVDTIMRDQPIAVWVSAALGPGYASRSSSQRLVGGQLALWVSDGSVVFAIRRAGASSDSRDTYDTAALLGVRARSPYVTAVAAAGLGAIGGTHLGKPIPSEPTLSFAGELAINVTAVGVGIATFAAIGPRYRLVGGGLVLEVGKIQ
jgi:hypothetical protein